MNLSEADGKELVRALNEPVLVKYLKELEKTTEQDIVNSIPDPEKSLEYHYREVRFAQGNLHVIRTLLEIGAIKTE